MLACAGRCAGFWLRRFEVNRPGELDENRHRDRRQDGISRMIREANWQKAKDERLSFLPIPEILMKNVNRRDEQGQKKHAN